MNTLLWVLQALLGATFLTAGTLKTTLPISTLIDRLGAWVQTLPSWMVRAIGGAEILGAIGLVLPGLAHRAVWVTSAAAIGLLIMMVGAIVVHGRRREVSSVAINAVLAALLVIVVGYRLGSYPL